MSSYYLTLGVDHELGPGYIEIEAESESEARETMVELYGTKWCTSYNDYNKLHELDRVKRGHLTSSCQETKKGE